MTHEDTKGERGLIRRTQRQEESMANPSSGDSVYRLRGKRIKYAGVGEDDDNDDSDRDFQPSQEEDSEGEGVMLNTTTNNNTCQDDHEDAMAEAMALSPQSHRRELRRHSNRECARRIRQRREATLQELESKRDQLLQENEHLLEIACSTLITWQRIVYQNAMSTKKSKA